MNLAINVEERTAFRKIDWNFVVVILSLNIVGLINLFSATHGPQSTEVEGLFLNQIIWLATGWSLFFIMTILDYNILSRLAWVFFLLNLGAILWVTFLEPSPLVRKDGSTWDFLGTSPPKL